MRLNSTNLIGLVGGALWAIVSGSAALADETELFIGTSLNEKPNILFILDNSGSMGTLIATQTEYDPSVTYAGSCSATRIYYRTGTGSSPNCATTSNYFDAAALACKAGADALTTIAGRYTDVMAQYDASSGSGGRRWELIDNNRRSAPVECKSDNGVHGDGNPSGDVYPRNTTTTAADAWANAPNQGSFAWDVSSRTDRIYTIYSANYLNWERTSTVYRSRLQIVQEVTKSLLDEVNGVNVGLMTFSSNSQGGYVVRPLGDVATTRDAMKTAVDTLSPGGLTPLSETLYEASQYLMGRSVYYGTQSVASSRQASNTSRYDSPLDLSCQKNYVVFLTDGEPTSDSDADAKIKALSDEADQSFSSLVGTTCDVEEYPSGFSPSGGVCLDELAEFMYDGDLSKLPAKQSVNTYTIGFTVDLPILKDTADRGGGQYYTADDTASLANVLSNIVTDILTTSTTFTSPTVSVNALNQTRNLDDLYVAMFTPSGTSHWPGNLKKYRLLPSGKIVDKFGADAINPGTGFFSESAHSYWSAEKDGATVTAGGAASNIPNPRTVYTYLGGALSRVQTSNASISDALLGTGTPDEPSREDIIAFINGLGTNGEPRHELGDPMSAQPVSVVYGPTNENARVYFVTNDGYLHSIDTQNGQERWAFLAPEFLQDQVEIFADNSVPTKRYGFDANLRVQIEANSDGVINGDEKVYLYFGMRRGGDTYYALDVSKPDAPEVLWRKDSTSIPGIGQSWSTPTPTKMNIGGAVTRVLVLGGGYSPSQDNQTSSIDTIGNSIYILNAGTGNVLWRGSNAAATGGVTRVFSTATTNGSMDYSFPGDVNVLDINGDGLADRLYAGDMGGQVWRFDVLNGQSAANLINGGLIAQLGAAPSASPTAAMNRRFYYAPDSAIVSRGTLNYVHVGIGSGHRAHPNSTLTQDRFYALRDYAVTTVKSQAEHKATVPITDGALVDVTDTITAKVPQGSPGWKFELRLDGWVGEKILAESRVFDDKVLFNSYTPNAGTGVGCMPSLGLRRQYQISVFDGSPVTNLDASDDPNELTASDRFTQSDGAPLSTPQFIFISDDPIDLDGDGEISEKERDTNGDGLITDEDGFCLGDTCVEECSGLICRLGTLNTSPIRTFWAQEAIE